MTRIELSADQQAVLQAALKQVADGEPVILTAKGVDISDTGDGQQTRRQGVIHQSPQLHQIIGVTGQTNGHDGTG